MIRANRGKLSESEKSADIIEYRKGAKGLDSTYEGSAWLATSSSYSFSSFGEAHRSSAVLKIRTTPSLEPVTISPFGIEETVHTDVAGWTIVCTHSSSNA